MDLFSRSNLKADSTKIKQVKTWIAEILNLDEQVTISLNQLTCHEPGCPPIETAIVNTETCPCALRRTALMRQRRGATLSLSALWLPQSFIEQPPKQYKIHKSIAEIERSDIEELIRI